MFFRNFPVPCPRPALLVPPYILEFFRLWHQQFETIFFKQSKVIIMKAWSPRNFFFANMLGNITESQPPHRACPTSSPIPCPGINNHLWIAMHCMTPSFSSPTPPFLELLRERPNWLGFHQAPVLRWQELSPRGPLRFLGSGGGVVSVWGQQQSLMDEWSQPCMKNISKPSQERRQLFLWRNNRWQEEVLAFTWRSLLAAS